MMMLTVGTACLTAQDDVAPTDTIIRTDMTDKTADMPLTTADVIGIDTLTADTADTLGLTTKDIKQRKQKAPRDWATWRPDPQRAMWLAMVLPGAGQIYNRKYWKLPIFYGGMMGCLYAMNWNNMMYKDYSQAYLYR